MSPRGLSIEEVAQCQHPGDFLRVVIASAPKKISLAQICERSGISSKGYLSDVLNNKKGLSFEAGRRLSRGLKLNSNLTKYLDLLILTAESRSMKDRNEIARNEELLARQRKKLRYRRKSIRVESKSQTPEAEQRIVFQTFAGIGDSIRGSSFAQVMKRTQLTGREVQKAIVLLLKCGHVQKIDDRYIAKSDGVDLEGLAFSPDFKRLFAEEAIHIANQSKALLQNKENLCLYGAFTCRKDRRQEFKEKLRDLLFDFMDEADSSDGEKIANLFCAFY